MKRILPLILALLMLLALVPAQAEVSLPAQVYRIVLRTETGDQPLGTGILFGTTTTLLTAAGCWAEGELYAIGQDGEHAISYRGAVVGSQLITMGLATPSTATPCTATNAERLLDYKLYGVNAQGEPVAIPVSNTRNTVIDRRAEVLIYATEGLLPGAMMFGDDMGLACITVWQETEGEGVYGALADVTLRRLFGGDDSADESDDARLLQGFTARCENGQIIVDWSMAGGYTIEDDTVFTVYSSVTSNTYLTRDVLEEGETTAFMPAIPETEVMVWVCVSTGELEEPLYPESAAEVAIVNVPAAQPFTLNGLRNVRMGLTPGEPGMDGTTTDFLPQEPLTREALSDRTRPIYFQTEDVYTCTEEDDDHILLVTLYTPEGYSFYYLSGYVFMPAYSESDLWVSDVSEIFSDYERFCEGEPWPAGEYTVLYTIDGGEVAHITFTLD